MGYDCPPLMKTTGRILWYRRFFIVFQVILGVDVLPFELSAAFCGICIRVKNRVISPEG
jgi:hypothetical protein